MEIAAGDIIFLDTIVLLTATDESRQHHRYARRVITSHRRSGFNLGISGQIIREYLVVATRPQNVNGLGLDPAQALQNVEAFKRRLVFFGETEAVSNELRRIVSDFRLAGTRIHDANVAATMIIHGISKLVTENQGDFTAFSDLETIGLGELSRLTIDF